ncbi:response regulator [Aquibacillus sp. 3ASR75-11]|uniref:Response regulator n=1 Tax=Terrihalobacillus insolitus TaxID=2950438 RepID=A0A9X3WNE2_9BACI|nr:response regulator [Terrihalobacillus insolitus]MDC3412085.1 response regulator [Terrihalobacillus insolitus]MDC3423222.1 response regulator [Terrihalobacillus insolitus]
MFRILVVDDEGIERQAMRQILTQGLQKVEVIGEATNGREAIRLASEQKPDIVLMDIKMPGIDGVQAVKMIKKAQPDTKFIMVSAYDTFEYAREVMREGVKEYLLKPTKKKEIMDTVGRVIREIRNERMGQQDLFYLNDEKSITQSLLQDAVQYIHEHYGNGLTLEATATHVDLSPYYFSKYFKEQMGKTFIDYVTDIRMDKAKKLLRKTHLSQKEICFEVGYHDPNYFSRAFKKVVGSSPSKYREDVRHDRTLEE